MSQDNFWDNVSDWFKVLLKSGIPALMIGLGWISTIVSLFLYGSAANSNLAFWVGIATGVLMIVLGYRLYKIELEGLARSS